MKYQYWLSNIPGVGCKTIHRLLGQAGSAEEIYFLKKEQLEKLSGLSDRQVHAITDRKKNWNLEEKYAALGESGISFLSCEMESYPKQLRNIVISQKEEWRSSGRECARNTERQWQNKLEKNWHSVGQRF